MLHELGFAQCRVRHHGDIARVEVEPEQIERASGELRAELARRLRALGFTYVTLDLDGFRSGSMNESAEHRDGAMTTTHGQREVVGVTTSWSASA